MRRLFFVLLFSVSFARAQSYDTYFGSQLLSCTGGAKGYFYTEIISNRAWFCTPLGNVYNSKGVFSIVPNGASSTAKYGDQNITWGPQTVRRMHRAGFYTVLGGAATSNYVQPYMTSASWPGDHSQPQKTPAEYWIDAFSYPQRNVFSYCTQAAKDTVHSTDNTQLLAKGGQYHYNVDPFDPCYSTWITAFYADTSQDQYQALAGPSKAWTLGVMVGESDYATLFSAYKGFVTHPMSGNYGENVAVLIAMAAPLTASNYNPTTYNVLMPTDRQFYGKTEWINWLQASGTTSQTPTACSRAGNVVTCTFTSNVFKGTDQSGSCIGDIVTLTGFTPSSFNTVAGTGGCVKSYDATHISFNQTSADETATIMGTVKLGPGYATIASLNTAWATTSFYTQFASTGTNATQGLAGSGNGPYTATLTHIPDEMSVWIKNNAGVVVAGGGALANETGFVGPAVTAGSINYSTGAISVTFSSAPGCPCTADYYWGGWGTGTGVADENGQHSWVPSVNTQEGGSAGMATDISNFLYHVTAKALSVQRNALKASYPNALMGGVNTTCFWMTPCRPEVLTAMGIYQDYMKVDTGSPTLLVPDLQARVDFDLQYAGRIPIVALWYSNANPDSDFNRPTVPIGTFYETQKQWGDDYSATLQTMWNMKGSNTNPNTSVRGYYPFAGLNIWSWTGNSAEGADEGPISQSDNFYDGVESCNTPTTDFAGYTTNAESVLQWAAGQAFGGTGRYAVSATVSGTVYLFEATTAGTAGGSAPAWCATLNCTANDGSVVWTNKGTRGSNTCYGDRLTGMISGNNYWWGQLSTSSSGSRRGGSSSQNSNSVFK